MVVDCRFNPIGGLLVTYLLVISTVCYVQATTTSGSHHCIRPCDWPAQPMTCKYEFRVEWFSSMATYCQDCPLNITHCDNANCVPLNGVQRPIITVNRLLPGPSIQVCEGDTIHVTVHNMLDDHEELTIHWHGLHQVNTPFMDGVPKVTQCPIPYGSNFVYTFEAAISGTHYWHAHSGHQRADGCAGTLVVRQAPKRDVHSGAYDVDDEAHVLLIQDWFHSPTLVAFVGHHLAGLPNTPDSILINGRGQSRSFETQDNTVDPPTYTPREILRVEPQKVHRFRIVNNGVINCPLQVSVDNHTINVISTDGRPVMATPVDAFVIFAGERFDFLLSANQDVGNYWLRVIGLGDCDGRHELAIIRYEGAHEHNPSLPAHFKVNGIVLNPYNEVDQSDTKIPIHLLKSLEDDLDDVLGDDVTTYYLPLDFNSVSRFSEPSPMSHGGMHMSKRATDGHDPHGGHDMVDNSTNEHGNDTGGGHGHGDTTSQINHASFLTPPANLLTQLKDIDHSLLCDVTEIDEKCKTEYCQCIQVLKAKLNEVIELVLVDEGFGSDQSHPMHIHGHAFRVIAQERKGGSLSIDHIKTMDDKGAGITRNLVSPPLKDTVAVPDGGYTIVRFRASNPGWWLFHCHIQFHSSNGMSLVIRVGNEDDVAPVPDNFPICNDWPAIVTHARKNDTMCEGSGVNALSGRIVWITVVIPLLVSCLFHKN